MSIKDKKLLYHITDIKNLYEILAQGLLPRSQLANFVDVADPDILESRKKLKLEDYVPFHFFARNPFDGRVQVDHPDIEFILITISREFAENNGWKIIPCHPLANKNIELLNYEEGIKAINWDKMNERDYTDIESKSVGMAECLSPEIVQTQYFYNIYVRNVESQKVISELLKQFKLTIHVNINEKMFIGK